MQHSARHSASSHEADKKNGAVEKETQEQPLQDTELTEPDSIGEEPGNAVPMDGNRGVIHR